MLKFYPYSMDFQKDKITKDIPNPDSISEEDLEKEFEEEISVSDDAIETFFELKSKAKDNDDVIAWLDRMGITNDNNGKVIPTIKRIQNLVEMYCRSIEITVPKGFTNYTLYTTDNKNYYFISDTNDINNWDYFKVKLDEPKYKWKIKNVSKLEDKKKLITIIDSPIY